MGDIQMEGGVSVQFSSVAQSSPTLFDPMNRSTPGLPVHHQLLESTQTHIHRVGDAIQPSHPYGPLLFLPSIFPSITVFSNESALCIRWPKYWSFSFNISPSNEHPGLISFRMDWLDLLAVQETLKSLLEHHSSKASILLLSAFFTVQLSRPYMTTGKTIALTRWTFVDKVMSLLFNMLSRLVIIFLPRSKRLLISWLQSKSAVILEPQKINSATLSTVSPSIFHEVTGLDAMILVFWMLSFKPTFSLCWLNLNENLVLPIDAFELWRKHPQFWRRLLRVPWTARRSNQSILKEINSECSMKDWCWSSNTLATWNEEMTHCKILWCWERLKAKGEESGRGWDVWMASPTQWTGTWAHSERVKDREA